MKRVRECALVLPDGGDRRLVVFHHHHVDGLPDELLQEELGGQEL